MPRIVKSTILDAPTQRVWEVLRDFNGHDRWHPAVATSQIERAQASDKIGCVRRFKLKDGVGTARAIAGAVGSSNRPSAIVCSTRRSPCSIMSRMCGCCR